MSSIKHHTVIAVSSATTRTLVDDAAETLYYILYVLWDLVGVDDEGTRGGRRNGYKTSEYKWATLLTVARVARAYRLTCLHGRRSGSEGF